MLINILIDSNVVDYRECAYFTKAILIFILSRINAFQLCFRELELDSILVIWFNCLLEFSPMMGGERNVLTAMLDI